MRAAVTWTVWLGHEVPVDGHRFAFAHPTLLKHAGEEGHRSALADKEREKDIGLYCDRAVTLREVALRECKT